MTTAGRLASTLLKFTGVFVAFGYVSLKSHLAVLGVPFDASLGVERYLAEAYQLAIGVINPVLRYLPGAMTTLAAAVIVVGLGSRLVPRRLRERAHTSFCNMRRSALSPAFLILAAAALYPLALRDVPFTLTAPFVGPLNGYSYFHLPQFFTALLLICGATFLAYDGFSADEWAQLTPAVRLCWRAAAVTVAVLLCFAPVIYGTLWHPMDYPTVRISMKDGTAVECGVLLLKTDSFMLWRADHRAGELLSVPISEAHAYTQGPAVDMRVWVKQAIDTGGKSPVCDAVSAPPVQGH